MRALVAGGAGFIGSHLCDRLLQAGHEVVCVDNLLTGSRRNIGHLENRPGFVYRQHDVTHPLDERVEAIFHLASPASPNPYSAKSYLRFPLETALANALGTYQLLELAARQGAQLTLASSSEVYGDPEVHPQPERYWGNVNPIGPRSCYDESKRFAETLCVTFRDKYQVDVRIARIFNTYGPRMDPEDGRLIPNLATQALRGAPMTIYGDGTQTRSLCYVDDLVQGLELLSGAPAASGQVFNLGNAEEHTVLQYAQLIRELCGSRSELVYKPLPQDDPIRRCPDLSRIRAVVGWEPKVGLVDGLQRTIAWFRSEVLAAQT